MGVRMPPGKTSRFLPPPNARLGHRTQARELPLPAAHYATDRPMIPPANRNVVTPPSVITPGPGKTAPKPAPTAEEQVPTNDGRCNAVNPKSRPPPPVASSMLLPPSAALIVRKLCPRKRALTTAQPTAFCHPQNPSLTCDLLPLLIVETPAKPEPSPKIGSEHPQPFSPPPRHRLQEWEVPPSIATCRKGLSPRPVARPPAMQGPRNHTIAPSSLPTAVQSSLCRVASPADSPCSQTNFAPPTTTRKRHPPAIR